METERCTVAYCAYCKTTILNRTQKCPNCGSTRFRYDDEPAPAPPAAPIPEVRTVYVEKPVYQTVYVERPAPTRSERSWGVALVLCLFFGIWGFHRFYVGKVGSGVAYLFTAGWCGIGWLVDVIALLTGNFQDRYGLPLVR